MTAGGGRVGAMGSPRKPGRWTDESQITSWATSFPLLHCPRLVQRVSPAVRAVAAV